MRRCVNSPPPSPHPIVALLEPLSPRRHWNRFRILLVLLFAARGIMTLCIVPPFEGWDEYQHVAYIVHLIETDRDPILRETTVPDSALRAVVARPMPRLAYEQLGQSGAMDYAAWWQRTADPVFRPPSPPIPLYQAQHASLYYRLAAPIFKACGGLSNLLTAVATLRAVNLLLTAAAIWVACGALGRLCRDRRHAAAIGGLIALQPLFLLNAARVTSDPLGVLLATIAIAGLLELDAKRLLLRSLAIGLVIGVAILAKAVHLALLPLAAFCLVLLWLSGRIRAAHALAASLCVLIGAALPTQAYFRANLARFGSITPMQEAVINQLTGKTTTDLADSAMRLNWLTQMQRTWFRYNLWQGGWSFLSLPRDLVHAHQWLVLAGLLGLIALPRVSARRDRLLFANGRVPLNCVALIAATSAAMGYHMIQSQVALGTPVTNPWYAAAACPWAIALFYQGCLAWPLPPGRKAAAIRALLPVGLAGIYVGAEFIGAFLVMIPAYTGLPLGTAALSRLASLQPAGLGVPTLALSLPLALLLGLLGAAALGYDWLHHAEPQAARPADAATPRPARTDR